jgi:hypothetical protein
MVIKLLLAFLLFIKIVSAQNLIVNPDFEILAPGKSLGIKGWDRGGSVDYFHYHHSEPSLRIPNRQFGLVPPLNGQGYLGFLPFMWDYGGMEHIIGETTKKLVKGHIYSFSFYYKFSGNTSYYYAKKLEVLFTEFKTVLDTYDKYKNYNDEKLTCTFSKEILHDTAWHKYEGRFKANGGESMVVIGIFYQDSIDLMKAINKYESMKRNPELKSLFIIENTYLIAPNPLFKPNEYVLEEWPYYFIDKVELYDITAEKGDFTY